MKTKLLLTSIAVFFLAASLFACPAMADDAKIYPGALCQPRYDSYALYRPDDGRAYNNSNGTQTWICPSVRDTAADNKGWVYVIDQHYTQNVCCTLNSYTRLGVLLERSETKCSAGTSSAAMLLNFDSRINGAGDSFAFFKCTVPARYEGRSSGIVSYKLNEID